MARPINPHRKWTDDKIKHVLAFKANNTNPATMEKFNISSAQLHYWRIDEKTGKPFGTAQREAGRKHAHRRRAQGNGAAKHKSNGGGAAHDPRNITEALRSLDRWKVAQENNIRRGGHSSPYDYLAEHALRVLRGEV